MLKDYLYYKDDTIRLFLGDCITIMKLLPSNYVDIIVTDPPYLMAYKTNYRKNKEHQFCSEIAGDRDKQLITDSIAEFYRLLKNNSALYLFCNSNKIDFFKQTIEKYFTIKNIIVWVKNNWTAGDIKAQYGKQYELIIYANKGRQKINGKRLSDVWEFDKVVGKKQLHQNEKPLGLIEQIIEKSSNKNDIVLDAFLGSGTTAVAAKKLGRRCIGIEIAENYLNITKERLITLGVS